MPVKVTSTGRLPARLWDAQASREAAEVLVESMEDRAFVRGLDYRDRPLKPYTPATRRALAESGQSARVDLQQTGALRASFARAIVRVTDQGAVIELPSDQMAKAEALQETRPFWGVAPSDTEALNRAVPGIFARAVERAAKSSEAKP